MFCLAVDFHLPQSRKNSNHGPHKQNHQSSGVKGTLINGLQYTGDERLLGTINMRLYCSAIAAFFLASSANGKRCLRKMAVITGILGRLLRWECVVICNMSSHCFYHSLLQNEAFAPTNNHCFEIRSFISNSQLAASLATSQLSAVGNNANERVS